MFMPLIFLFLLSATAGDVRPARSSPFQCPRTQQFSTPNISKGLFNHESEALHNLRASRSDHVYIFTLPPCINGTVVNFEFCFLATNSDVRTNRSGTAFFFLSLIYFSTNRSFIVDAKYPVWSIARDNKCTPRANGLQICCRKTTNFHTLFPVPHSFGIVMQRFKLLTFTESSTEYVAERYLLNLGASNDQAATSKGAVLTINVNQLMVKPLLLLRIFIDRATTAHSTIPTTVAATTTLTKLITTSTATTTAVKTSGKPNESAFTNLPTTAKTDHSTSTDVSQLSFAAVGGGIGGAIVAVVVGLVIVVLCMVMVKRRWKERYNLQRNSNMSFQNEIYELAEDGRVTTERHYAGNGPHVMSGAGFEMKPPLEDSNYAECGAASHEVPDVPVETGYELTAADYDEVYMAPAKDEGALYSQIQATKTKYLARNSVKVGDLLGTGEFGLVYKGVLDSGVDGEVEVAVKTLKEGSRGEDRVKFLQEAAIMAQFKHHNVITIYGIVKSGEPILLVLELLSKGDLRNHLLHMRANEGGGVSVDDHTLLSYCRQVASGMAYLSSKAFVHRDLAARNILVSDDDICKISDFGMSRDLLDESYYVSHGGRIPVKWTAPEALHYKKYSTASDVWSYGALMYEIWSVGHKPFKNYANNKVITLIDTGYRLAPPPGCPRNLYNVMIMCWHPVTSERPSFLDINRQLSLPNTKLLKWTEEDKSAHPEAAQLGADLLCGEELYKDLQNRYKEDNTKLPMCPNLSYATNIVTNENQGYASRDQVSASHDQANASHDQVHTPFTA